VTFTKIGLGNAMIGAAAASSSTVGGMSLLEAIDTHAAAYGFIGAFTLGFIGIIIQRWQNGRIYKVEQEKLQIEQDTLDELKRHNRAKEEKTSRRDKTAANQDSA